MCVAIPPTNSRSESPGWVWLWLTAEPWHFLTLGGVAALVFSQILAASGYSSALFLAFGVVPFFISALVLTITPRWLGHDTTYDYAFLKHIAALAPAALLLLFYSLTGWTLLAVISAFLVTTSYLLLTRHLRHMLFWSNHRGKVSSRLILGFVLSGLGCSIACTASLVGGSADWVDRTAFLMNWCSTSPIILVIALKWLSDGSFRSQLVE